MSETLTTKSRKPKVYCMMSGGVDSSVAAAMLVKEGYDVTGVFMKNWSPLSIQSLSDCPWKQDLQDAEAVCRQLGISFRSVNFEKEYRQKVVDNFLSECRAGRTPNPDVVCNREIKFGIFLNWARSQGTDLVSSGHYVRLLRDSYNRLCLYRGIDANKDQSYFLWTLTSNQLSYCLFPIGELKKSEVRKIARDLGLPTASKKDSQGICFIGTINVGQFLRHEISAEPGRVIGSSGQIIGSHDGAAYYTIGQRHGFRLDQPAALSSLYHNQDIPPLFVVEKDLEKNLLYVGAKDDARLWRKEVTVTGVNWIYDQDEAVRRILSGRVSAQIRYRQKPVEVERIQTEEVANAQSAQGYTKSQKGDGKMIVRFKEPVWAAAAGQSIVFYDGNLLLGGAIIHR